MWTDQYNPKEVTMSFVKSNGYGWISDSTAQGFDYYCKLKPGSKDFDYSTMVKVRK